ncbi:hypothetical protein IM660_06265 [Ruania alkalisoli]|uniref:Uncharacterized protein n=1 Tax=Ruania alkalisoli TaxID=2779775 RepID=A0A7M1SWE3_9MICO|nr:hypothetical protein [Ruania alkalisoli]QOR71865.1 hypothetical protein IM660_06265 [Ruania alkalisoli]
MSSAPPPWQHSGNPTTPDSVAAVNRVMLTRALVDCAAFHSMMDMGQMAWADYP